MKGLNKLNAFNFISYFSFRLFIERQGCTINIEEEWMKKKQVKNKKKKRKSACLNNSVHEAFSISGPRDELQKNDKFVSEKAVI